MLAILLYHALAARTGKKEISIIYAGTYSAHKLHSKRSDQSRRSCQLPKFLLKERERERERQRESNAIL